MLRLIRVFAGRTVICWFCQEVAHMCIQNVGKWIHDFELLIFRLHLHFIYIIYPCRLVWQSIFSSRLWLKFPVYIILFLNSLSVSTIWWYFLQLCCESHLIEWASALHRNIWCGYSGKYGKLLAHLNQRLTRWANRIVMVCPSLSVVHTFKLEYLWSQLANLDQI